MPSITELFEQAVRHHQDGNLGLAENLYRQVLQADPRHGQAWHLLGLLAGQVGRLDLAVEHIGRALRSIPDFAPAHNNLGIVLRDQGNLDQAEACCREALRLSPDFADAYCQLGNILGEQARLKDAETCCRQALGLKPDYAEAHNNLGVILGKQARPEEAANHFRQALALNPRHAEAHSNLGNVLCDLGRLKEAETCFDEALRLRPDYAAAHNNLGNARRDQGKLLHAEASYREALRLKPGYTEAHYNLGGVLRDQGKLEGAEAEYRRAIQLKPGYAEAHNNLGNVLRIQGKLDEAQACLRAALRLKPDFAEAHSNLGNVLGEQGQLAQAEKCCRQALQLRPDMAEAHSNLGVILLELGRLDEVEPCLRAALGHDERLASAWNQLATLLRHRLPPADLEAMQKLRSDPGLTPGDRGAICFGLAQVLDARQEFEEAARCLAEANALTRDHWRQRGQVYDPAAHSRFVDRLLASFDAAYFERVRGLGVHDDRPIFIVGLPRSGTTLTEQILARHSQVFGAGELTLARDNFLRLAGDGQDPWSALNNLARLDGPTIRSLAIRHLDQLRALNDAARHVVDKMPDNYLYLGFLAALVPRAKIIHCRRDLRDIAVSCWMTNFRTLRWASAFEHLAARFCDYERVMDHWRQVLPTPVLEVDYEEIVADLEGVARRLISWCGLEWEAACLRFHEGARPVHTASAMQVRQPIFSHSVARWKHYEKWLAPLFAMLPQSPQSPR